MPTLFDTNAAAQPPRHNAAVQPPRHNATAQPPHHNVTIGDCVELDKESRSGAPDSEGGVGFIDQLNPDGTFDIRWVLGNRGEKNVRPQRILSMNPLALTARRSSSSAVERPSILCPSHQPESRAADAASSRLNSAATAAPVAAGPVGVSIMMLQSKKWSKFDRGPNPLLKYLHDGKRRENGWLRQSEAAARRIRLVDENGKVRKHLFPEENTVLVLVKEEVDRVAASKPLPEGYTPNADIRHAFGISLSKLKNCVTQFYQKNASSDRKRASELENQYYRSNEI